MQTETFVDGNDYYSKVNLRFLFLQWFHIPICLFIAFLNNTSFSFALCAGLAIVTAPTVFVLRDRTSLLASISNAMALVSFSALMIYLSNGMTELHFHIFSSLGLIIVLAQPLAILAALLVVVVHHVGFFFFLPAALINYQASFGILVVHAVFALAIGIPAMFISSRYKTYIVGVKKIVNELNGITSKMSGASASMFDNSKNLEAAISQEAEALQQTAASLEELNAMIGRNAQSAQTASESAVESKGRSEEGVQVVNEVVKALGDIHANSQEVLGAVDQGNQELNKIIQLINEIGGKTKVINDIVFQTKLLSFNASVEAARAGEHGKGFAVVAEEIGNLAQMSGNSAREITTLLDSSVASVRQIIEQTKSGVFEIVNNGKIKIEKGMETAEKCKSLLSQIDSTLNQVSATSTDIATASQEQAKGVNEIRQAMNNVESVSQKNSQVADQSAQIATELKSSSSYLTKAVNDLMSALDIQKAS